MTPIGVIYKSLASEVNGSSSPFRKYLGRQHWRLRQKGITTHFLGLRHKQQEISLLLTLSSACDCVSAESIVGRRAFKE